MCSITPDGDSTLRTPDSVAPRSAAPAGSPYVQRRLRNLGDAPNVARRCYVYRSPLVTEYSVLRTACRSTAPTGIAHNRAIPAWPVQRTCGLNVRRVLWSAVRVWRCAVTFCLGTRSTEPRVLVSPRTAHSTFNTHLPCRTSPFQVELPLWRVATSTPPSRGLRYVDAHVLNNDNPLSC